MDSLIFFQIGEKIEQKQNDVLKLLDKSLKCVGKNNSKIFHFSFTEFYEMKIGGKSRGTRIYTQEIGVDGGYLPREFLEWKFNLIQNSDALGCFEPFIGYLPPNFPSV